MSARARRPTDDIGTEIFDADRTRRAAAPRSAAGGEHDLTEGPPRVAAVEHATPTRVDAPRLEPGSPTEHAAQRERSEPIRVISMKDPPSVPWPPRDEPRVPLHVQLRSMAELSRRNDTPVSLGRLAPPRDPRQARARRLRDNAVWACVAIALASLVAVAVWLIAGR